MLLNKKAAASGNPLRTERLSALDDRDRQPGWRRDLVEVSGLEHYFRPDNSIGLELERRVPVLDGVKTVVNPDVRQMFTPAGALDGDDNIVITPRHGDDPSFTLTHLHVARVDAHVRARARETRARCGAERKHTDH